MSTRCVQTKFVEKQIMPSVYRRTLLILALSVAAGSVQAVEPMSDSDLGANYMQLQDTKKLSQDMLAQNKSAQSAAEQKDDESELHLEIAKAADPVSTPALQHINLASATNIRFDPDALSKYIGEYASRNIGSERYSYFWQGNYDKIYNDAATQRYLYDGSSRTFVLDGNIHGTVVVTADRISSADAAQFFRSNWVF